MANMKLKKPILLQEEFAAGEVSNPNQNATPAVQTSTNTVGIDKTSGPVTGEEVRAEIVKDVDTILTNLEALSKQITESIDSIIEEVFGEDIDLELNENAGATLMAMFKAGAAAGKLNAKYPKLLKKKKKAELDKKIAGFKFDAEKQNKLDQAEGKLKDAINKKIDAVDDPAKKKQMRVARDEKVKAQLDQASKKLDRSKEDYAKKMDRNVEDVQAKITKLLADNKVSDAPLIAAQWDKTKIKIDRDTDDAFLKKERKVMDEFIEDEDRIAKWEKAAADRVNKENKEEAEASKKAAERAEAAQAKLDADIANASEDEKAALEKVKAYMGGISAFSAATTASAGDPKNKELYKEAKAKLKELNDAYNAIGKKDYALAFGYEGDSKETDVEAAKLEFQERIQMMEEPFDDIAGPDDDEETETAKTSKQLADEFIAGNEGFKVIQDKGATVGVTNQETGEEEQKPKYEGEKDFKGKKEDGSDDDVVTVAKEISYTETQSANTGGGKALNEGLHPKLKKAMKAVEKGETVYGENVRFPGRFKIIEMGELFATVDYEDGTEPMEMASMNIAIDKLQFEAVEIEEGNEFGAARAEAIAKGEKTFKVGDEEYPVEDVSKEDEENAEEYADEEGIATEAVTESSAFKMGSVSDRFKALM